MDVLVRPTTAETVVSVKGLSKAYGGRGVVRDLDLEIVEGEVVGLVGSNGAGKTTTVECLQGLRQPDRGEIHVLGLDPAHDADRLRLEIGSQLQNAGLPDRLRVDEAIALFDFRGVGDPHDLLRRFGLAHRRRYAVGNMSGGERQRLFLVLALLNEPRLVVLDELTQGLDPVARREVWRSVGDLRASGTTVFLVTHELAEAESLCDRVVVMHDGRVLDHGPPSELVARHARDATIRFTDTTAGIDGFDTADALSHLPHVRAVQRDRSHVVVLGDRPAIAHVGAWLLDRPGPFPSDLHVAVPNLEDAVIRLLRADEEQGHVT